MSELRPGQLVTGIVIEHQPFGAFIEIGEDEPGLALITMLEDEPRSRTPALPPIGSHVEAVFLGFSGPSRQPRLSLRPMEVRNARDAE
jgi:predicted RNA-binding protein with RPS1 domain